MCVYIYIWYHSIPLVLRTPSAVSKYGSASACTGPMPGTRYEIRHHTPAIEGRSPAPSEGG